MILYGNARCCWDGIDGNQDGGVDHYDLSQPVKMMCAEAKIIEICDEYLLI